MMRLARRASLLVAFSLLTSAATAYAECAWVLWWSDNKNTTWSILDAFPKLADCDQSLNGDMNALKRDGYEVHGAPGTGHGFDAKKDGIMKVYQCLPDTIDPRGPKGK